MKSSNGAGSSGHILCLKTGGKILANHLYEEWKITYNLIREQEIKIERLESKLYKKRDDHTPRCKYGDRCHYRDQASRRVCKHRHVPNLKEQIGVLERQIPKSEDTGVSYSTIRHIKNIYREMNNLHKINTSHHKLTNIKLYVTFGGESTRCPLTPYYCELSEPKEYMPNDPYMSEERNEKLREKYLQEQIDYQEKLCSLIVAIGTNIVFFFRNKGFTVDPPDDDGLSSGKIWLYS